MKRITNSKIKFKNQNSKSLLFLLFYQYFCYFFNKLKQQNFYLKISNFKSNFQSLTFATCKVANFDLDFFSEFKSDQIVSL